MPCTTVGHGRYRAIVCTTPFYRLPLADGRRVFLEWHSYCGPTFYHDRSAGRVIWEWWENELICDALKWFCDRGHRA